MSFFLRSTLSALTLLAVTASAQLPNTPPPTIFTAATQQRAAALLHQMTTEEKIGQLEQLFVFRPDPAIDARIRAGRMGSALFVTDPGEINRLQHLAVEDTRLHIPLIFGFDVIHGFRTIFPVPLAMASSWDPSMVEHAQAIAASEARSVGIAWAFAPMLDIARDPRWGRIVEGAGEDPFLGAAIARAQVRGFQGDAIGAPDHVLACAKHFAGYGAAEGGRDYDASYISDVQLENIYLQPFHAAVDAGVGSLMSAYMDLNDVPATGNSFLLHDTLRETWGFKGFVVSDANAVISLQNHGFAADREDAAVRALTAGVNMEMATGAPSADAVLTPNSAAPPATGPAYDQLSLALKQGKITLAQIDAAVLPILEAKIQLGLFEHPYADIPRSEQVLSDPAHRTAALHAAERSIVLLQNRDNLLPLTQSAYKSIAIIGPTGTNPYDLTGSWTFVQNNAETVTLAKALTQRFGSSATVTYAPGVQIDRHFPSFFDQITRDTSEPVWTPEQAKAEFDKAVELARHSDLILLTVGEHQKMSGEAASTSSLELAGDQLKLISAVASLGKPVVLLLQSGRPLDITTVLPQVPAILEVWDPGTEGGAAIANILFGDVAPGAHLPLAWPRNVGQIPINYAHNLTQDASKQGERYWNEPSTPLFPFGFGLSYSTFAFSNLTVTQATTKLGSPVQVSVDIENTGDRTADDVAQLYIHQQNGRASRPVRELKGFERLTLPPHQKQTLHFTIADKDLQYWSGVTRSWIEDPTTFDLYAGDNADATLHTTFTRIAR
jgi:beta-glucosidase